MQISAVELHRVGLPMKRPFRAPHGVVRARDTLLVQIHSDVGVGWGECPALGAPTYTHEWMGGAELVLAEVLAPRLLGRDISAAEVSGLFGAVAGHGLARAALELAVLDAELRAEGRSLAGRLGAVRTVVDCGAAIGLADTVAEVVAEVGQAVAAGFRRVKLKISPGWDRQPLAAVRQRFPDLLLQADANGSYRPGDHGPLLALDDLDLALVEQPFPPDAVRAHAALAKALRTPVCLDESLTSFDAADDALALGACEVACLKPGHLGGWLEAVRVHDLCQAKGVPAWCGGMLESGVGRAGNLALAALSGCTLPGDLAPTDRWFAADVTAPLSMDGGRMKVPTGPGIGVEVDEAAVAELRVGHRVVGG